MSLISNLKCTFKPFVFDKADNLVEIQSLFHFDALLDLGESLLHELLEQDG